VRFVFLFMTPCYIAPYIDIAGFFNAAAGNDKWQMGISLLKRVE